MTGLNHAVTGALVAAAINEPVLALPAALLSHFAADMVPHWDYKVPGGLRGRQAVMAVDLILSVWLLFVLTFFVDATPWLVVAGGLLAILPDVMWLRFFMTGRQSAKGNKKSWLNKLRRFHHRIQWSETSWGIYVEAVWFLAMLFLIVHVQN